MGNSVGRPQNFTPEELEIIAKDFEEYIDTHDDPIVVGFTSTYKKYPVYREYITQHKEFSPLVKRCVEKQEAFLLNPSTKEVPVIRIFRLKQPQHGYKDKTEQDIKFEEVVPILGGKTKNVRSDDSDK